MKDQLKDRNAFPTLSTRALDRLYRHGSISLVDAETIVVDQGEPMDRFIVVLDGEIAVELSSRAGLERVAVHGPGEFFGDVHSLSGRPSLVRGRMSKAGRLLTIDRHCLKTVMQDDAELGEILMRAFILRRIELLSAHSGDTMVLGSLNSSGTLRTREFLTRNGYPYSFIDLDKEADVQHLLDEFEISAADIPVLIQRDNVLRNPPIEVIARALGLNASVSADELRDVVIVGAGPAGLSAAVYAASEGLGALVLEAAVPGGQAGSSSKIENYLGFPNGVSGLELTARAYDQAQKFGAELLVAKAGGQLACGVRPFELQTREGTKIRSKTVVIATGAQYRKLPLANLEKFEGVGIYYGAATIEAQMCLANEVIVVGGGNSAGQAAVFLSKWASRVHILIRSAGLASTMSRYLIRRIEDSSNITLHPHTELVGVQGNQHLESVVWLDNRTGQTQEHHIRHVYLMTGASPNTEWLRGCVALDEKGFVLTGPDLTPEILQKWSWSLSRKPYLLESSVPGVFAAGDVRAGSVKRVASGVGEGSLAISFIHKVLAE